MDRQMYHYATVTKALEELNKKGFSIDYNLDENIIDESFEIQHIYRYEGITDPGDEATVYGVKSPSGEKGVFVAGPSSFAESAEAQILNDLSIRGRAV